MRIRSASFALVIAVLVSDCGGDDAVAPSPITVSIGPANANLAAGGSQDFTATVANDASMRGVTWTITGCAGGPTACGTLANMTGTSATYTAPTPVPTAIQFGVTATSVSDNTKSFTATVAVSASGAVGQIAFTSNRDGNLELYLMNTDGTGLVNLTNNSDGEDMDPAWSPDGSKLAFATTRDGNFELYLMNADGTGIVNLTNTTANERYPAWSPDGSKIAFHTDRDFDNEV